MPDKSTITILHQCIDMLEDDLEGMPLHIERPGKKDFVLVSSATFSSLMQRIFDLEQAAMSNEERRDEEIQLLRELRDTDELGCD
ncbi:hypothetical protein ACEWPM_015650 [Roseovarius sp. S4756]|uniref:hypothetical protein n=1 Tax=Roseovarius maritimus TaxID=3342637 RepID=UPI00372B5D30